MRERSIFLAALERDPHERPRFVAEACGADHPLRDRVTALLEAHDSGGSILETPAADRLAVPSVEAIPGYTLLREIHRGGQGVVYQAVQQSTGQKVALKVLLEGPFVGATAQRRFELEIELAVRLRHRNIAKLFDRGVADGHFYYVMEYIQGRFLTQYVRDESLSTDDMLRLFKQVCDVVDYAHQHGVIHRDLKPSNILVDDSGEPYVLDFGLAKAGDNGALGDRHSEGVSANGQILGTPAYMSPEQASGQSDRIDLRSDVYALGVMLYEMLTGQMPYEVTGQITDVLKNIELSAPTRPRKLGRKIGDEVEMIVLKALSKEKERRYATAGLLGEDVGRYLAGQPIEAKRDSVVYVLGKTLRRYKASVAAAAVLAGVVTVSSVISFAFWRQAVADRDAAERERIEVLAAKKDADAARELAEDAQQTAIAQADDLRRRLYGYHIRRAAANLDLDHTKGSDPIGRGARIIAAGQLLAECPAELRHWEWDWLHANVSATPASLFPGQARPYYTPDGTELMVAADLNSDGINTWNLRTGKTVRTLGGQIGSGIQIALSPSGKQVAAIDQNGTCVLWDIAAQRAIWWIQAHADLPSGITFRQTGDMLATACRDGTLSLWSAETGARLRTIGPLGYPLRSAVFSPDGRHVAVAAHGYRGQPAVADAAGLSGRPATVWDVATGEPVTRLPPQGGAVHCVAYHPEGNRIVTGGADRRVRIWDAETSQELRMLTGHTDLVHAVAYHPNGKQIASSSGDGTICLWDSETGQQLAKLNGLDDVREICFSPSGSQIAFYDVTRGIGLWDLRVDVNHSAEDETTTLAGSFPANAIVLQGHEATIRALEFSPDGRQLASASFDKTVRLWDVQTGQELRVLRGHTKWALSLAFSPDGQQLLSGEHVTDSTAFADIKLWDVGSGRPLRSFRAHKGGVWWLAFNAQGDRFASAGSESLARVWDLDSGRQLSTLQHARGAVEGIAFRQDGSQLITLDAGDDHLKMWDPHTGQPLGEFTMPSESGRCLAISRDGRRVATGGAQGIARIWDAQTGAHLRDIRGHGLYVTSVAFAADGTRLFTASLDKTVRVWNADTGEELLALKGHSQGLWSVVVSPDGNKIASAGEDGTVVIWDANLVTDEIQLARKNVQRARRAVDERFAELALASDVIESLRGGTSFDSPTLELALQIAAARGDDPYRLIERSREICGQPHQEDSRYVEAHQYAQIACDAIPDAPELLAVLGLAEYRVRAYKAALETLRRCDETDRNQGSRPRPEVWSVMAMSNFQLGQREEAQAALKQAQALLQEPEWAENPVHHSLVQETAQLIDPQGSVLTATQPSSR